MVEIKNVVALTSDSIEVTVQGLEGDRTMELSIDVHTFRDRVQKYEAGMHIQDAFPMLNADQREFLLTGISGDEFDELFEGELEE